MKKEDVSLREELKKLNLSLIAVDVYSRYESDEMGIKPILNGLEKDRYFFKGKDVYDKIVGKAAAMLFVYSEAKSVFGVVMSKNAVEILGKYGIEHAYETLTDSIINRKGDDICPMEKTVKDIEDISEAYMKLKERSRELSK